MFSSLSRQFTPGKSDYRSHVAVTESLGARSSLVSPPSFQYTPGPMGKSISTSSTSASPESIIASDQEKDVSRCFPQCRFAVLILIISDDQNDVHTGLSRICIRHEGRRQQDGQWTMVKPR
ncbi:MAG: hypothetical protein AAF664_15680 [Planctomycetota bacterium]